MTQLLSCMTGNHRARFEQKGLIAFESPVKSAIARGYTPDIENLFGAYKFDTIVELDLILRKRNDKGHTLKTKSNKMERTKFGTPHFIYGNRRDGYLTISLWTKMRSATLMRRR